MLTYQNGFIKLSAPGPAGPGALEDTMERRAALNLLGLAGIAGALGPLATDDAEAGLADATAGSPRLFRIPADTHGDAHLEELVLAARG